MEEVLATYILYEQSNITRDFVNNLITGQHITRTNICSYITHLYCAHALTPNIWVLKQIKLYFEQISKCKSSDKETFAGLCYGLFHLIANLDKKHYKFCNTSDRKDLFLTDISNIIHTLHNGDNDELSQMKNIINADVYKLLNIIYDSFVYSVQSDQNLQRCFLILRYLLTLPPRSYYAEGKKLSMDMYDFMFYTCIAYSQNTTCPPSISDYITLTKDLFYFQVKKRDKIKRANLLFYVLYTIIYKHTQNQEIDYEGASNILHLTQSNSEEHQPDTMEDIKGNVKLSTEKACNNESDNTVIDKCKYLFIYTHYDHVKCQQIQAERERNKLMAKLLRTSTKNIEVESLSTREPGECVYVSKVFD